MKKKLLLLPIMLLFSTLIVSFGSSIWIFDANKQVEVEPKIKVDDIEENYNVETNSQLSSDYYTIRFYAQPYASHVINSSTTDYVVRDYEEGIYFPGFGYSSIEDPAYESKGSIFKNYGEDADGYWSEFSNSTSRAELNSRHGYKEIEVYKTLKYIDLLEIGRPSCSRLDDREYSISFVGWCVDASIAKTNAYCSQGDYGIIDLTKPLSYYDNDYVVDNSNAGDNIITLFAIYTSGKDYSKNGEIPAVKGDFIEVDANGEPIYENNNKKTIETRWFGYENYSLTNNENVNKFYYRNLLITPEMEQSKKNVININISFPRSSGWTSDWFFVGEVDANEKEKDIILKEGYYNIFVFICDTSSTIDDYLNSEYEQDILGTNFPYVKTKREIRYNYSLFTNKTQTIYTIIEKIFEFKLVGGPIGTHDFANENAEGFNIINYNEQYSIENIYFSDIDNYFTHIHNDYHGHYKKSIFTLGHMIDTISNVSDYTLVIADDNESKRLLSEVSVTNGDYYFDSVTPPNLSEKLLKVNESGYYNFEIEIVYNSDLTGEIHYDNIDYILVKATKTKDDKFLKIYDLRNENFEVIPKNSNGFVDHTNDIYNSYLKYESVNLTTNINIKDVILVDKQTNQNITMQDLITLLDNNNLALYDHVTETEINQNLYDSNYIFTKNYIFYIKNKSS